MSVSVGLHTINYNILRGSQMKVIICTESRWYFGIIDIKIYNMKSRTTRLTEHLYLHCSNLWYLAIIAIEANFKVNHNRK